jgi:hypothetical protein
MSDHGGHGGGHSGGHGKHESNFEMPILMLPSMLRKTFAKEEFFNDFLLTLGGIFADLVANPIKGGGGAKKSGGGGHHH